MNIIRIEDFANPSESRIPTFSGEPELVVKTWENVCHSEKIDKVFWNVDMNKLKILHPIVFASIVQWMNSDHKKTLYLWGSVGSGKTYTALSICRYFFETFRKKPLWFRYLPAEKIIEKGEAHGVEYLKEIYGECKLLFVDDLGVEACAEWQIKYFFALFNARYANGLTTIVTSNLSLDSLKAKVTERVTSRMVGTQIEFPKIDLRKYN